jgi:hypothetical protein
MVQLPRRGFQVHRLVAAAFVPNPLGKPQVNHLNGQRADNGYLNLDWCTPSENITHAYRIGLIKIQAFKTPKWRESVRRSKKRFLNDAQVLAMRRRKASGETYATIASSYGVTISLAQAAIKGTNYAYVREPA